MNNDSTRKRRVQKTLGLHYSRFYLIARCIVSLFRRKILENRSSAAPVEKVGLEQHETPEFLPVSERGHDPLAVINRQTDFARRKLVKSFLDLHLRPLDFAIFVASLDRHRPFHRRLPQVGDFHETVLVNVSYPLSPQTFCRSHPLHEFS